MPVFFQKKRHFFKNTVISCHLFKFFHEKPPDVIAIFGQHNVISVKTILPYGPQKSIGYIFFLIFYENIAALVPIIYQKNVHSLKKTLVSSPLFVKKKVHSLKNSLLSYNFFNFFMKNPYFHAHIWYKKRQFYQNYTIL